MIWSLAFWKGAGERAIKTFAQVLGAVITVNVGTDLVPSAGVDAINWLGALSITGVAVILSVLTSIGNADFTAGAAEN